jgi:hypothetical protein
MLQYYRRLGARVVTIDPGEQVVLKRCKAERPWHMTQAAKRWYDNQRSRPAPDPQPSSVAMPW